MKNIIKVITDKFEFYFGWFFVNGMKHEKWQEKMKEKYGK